MRHGLRGQSFATLSACAAGAHAIGTAARMIQCGDADAVVTGGSEAALTPLATAAFAALDALSDKGISRPFDAQRDGFVMGEGAAVLVLEDGERARARGATILARLAGYGASSDAYHLTAPEKDGGGAIAAMEAALQRRGLRAAGRRVRQRARHLDPAQRPRRDDRDQARARRRRPGVLAEVVDRPSARRRRRRRGRRDDPGDARPGRAAHPQLRAPGRRARPRLRPQRGARHWTSTASPPWPCPTRSASAGHNAVLCLEVA